MNPHMSCIDPPHHQNFGNAGSHHQNGTWGWDLVTPEFGELGALSSSELYRGLVPLTCDGINGCTEADR